MNRGSGKGMFQGRASQARKPQEEDDEARGVHRDEDGKPMLVHGEDGKPLFDSEASALANNKDPKISYIAKQNEWVSACVPPTNYFTTPRPHHYRSAVTPI